MANINTTFTYVANDKLTPVLKKIKTNAATTFNTASSGAKKLANAVDKSARRVNRLDREMLAVNKTGMNMRSTFMRLGGVIGAAFGIREIWKLGTELEKITISYNTILGKSAGGSMMKDLNDFANKTPFLNKEVLKTGKVLLAAGIRGEDVTKTLRMIGDVASGAGVPLNDMANIYAKAMNKGKVQAEELMQLSERGVPILADLAAHYGKTTGEILKMGEKGELTSDVITASFDRMTSRGGIFFDLMSKQSQTVGGVMSSVIGKLQQNIGETFMAKSGGLLKILKKIDANFTKVIKRIYQLIKVLAILKVSWVVARLVVVAAYTAIKGYDWAVKALSVSLKYAESFQKSFNMALKTNVLGIVITAVSMLALKYIDLKKSIKGATDEKIKFDRLFKKDPFKAYWAGDKGIAGYEYENTGRLNTVQIKNNLQKWLLRQSTSLEAIKGVSSGIGERIAVRQTELMQLQKKMTSSPKMADYYKGSIDYRTQQLNRLLEIQKILKEFIPDTFNIGDGGVLGDEGVTLSSSRIAKNLTINIGEVVSENGINIVANSFGEGIQDMKAQLEEVFRDIALGVGQI